MSVWRHPPFTRDCSRRGCHSTAPKYSRVAAVHRAGGVDCGEGRAAILFQSTTALLFLEPVLERPRSGGGGFLSRARREEVKHVAWNPSLLSTLRHHEIPPLRRHFSNLHRVSAINDNLVIVRRPVIHEHFCNGARPNCICGGGSCIERCGGVPKPAGNSIAVRSGRGGGGKDTSSCTWSIANVVITFCPRPQVPPHLEAVEEMFLALYRRCNHRRRSLSFLFPGVGRDSH